MLMKNLSSPCALTALTPLLEYEYYQPGDVIIGGLISVHGTTVEAIVKDIYRLNSACFNPSLMEYRVILAFIFAIEEINMDSSLLPNITLGYHIYDTCADPKKSVRYALKILSGYHTEAPNYSCMKSGRVAGFVGDSGFTTTLALAQLLSLYRYTHISYQVTNPLLSDRDIFPTLYMMLPNDHIRYVAIVNCLEYFGWNWVGIITPSDGSGETELHELRKLMTSRRICIEFVVYLTDDYVKYIAESEKTHHNITFILNESWRTNVKYLTRYPSFNSSLLFLFSDEIVPGLRMFSNNRNPYRYPNDPFLEEIWIKEFHCLSSNTKRNIWVSRLFNLTDFTNCTGMTKALRDVHPHSDLPMLYYAYTAVYSMAHSLQKLLLDKRTSEIHGLRQKMNSYIKKLNYKDKIGKNIFLNAKGEIPRNLHVENWVIFRMKPRDQIHRIIVGWYEGSLEEDSEKCQKCPEEKWPDDRKVKCVPKTYDFLSYEKDILVLAFSVITVMFSAVTIFILGVFIYYWDTPIVKANNRTVSFILLTSILLSLLCVFLFLGRPVDITCMLRQVLFGMFFTIAVSSILGKTLTVCIIFKASKPGSSWKKWLSVKVSYYVILTCSSIQCLNCIIWLSTFPPYEEHDMHTYSGQIIIQCNDGSVLSFYSVWGYMGFLAAVSFLLAFIVRTLPDSFNEAKYITFSMLVFCSAWIAMIPAYLSTRGKYMVAVEVFAILTSSAGILTCIFFPKTYIIILKPDLNCHKDMLKNSKSPDHN
ncbi:vomeronasal type-2 receptor 26-like [Hyperolius riggenbachi]|uniref:vomeronasal type-2 receptor 26-like n=1 Tax=Hyperolius riggenbachi TaxID=752182 RepID=UPI0035A2EDD2